MNFIDYIEKLLEFHADAHNITESKALDYAGSEDPFRNFRDSAQIAGITPEQGLIVRMADKLSRARSLSEQGTSNGHVGESIAETMRDLSNYAGIYAIWSEQKFAKKEVKVDSFPSLAGGVRADELEPEPNKVGTANWFSKFLVPGK